jgi:hypothetical protein
MLGYFITSSFSGASVVGGFVGLISSGASNLRKYNDGEIEPKDAGIAIGKEAIGTGVATGVAVATSGILGHGLLILGGTALAVGIGVKYFWDKGVERLEKEVD